jgi:hypothetical protein
MLSSLQYVYQGCQGRVIIRLVARRTQRFFASRRGYGFQPVRFLGQDLVGDQVLPELAYPGAFPLLGAIVGSFIKPPEATSLHLRMGERTGLRDCDCRAQRKRMVNGLCNTGTHVLRIVAGRVFDLHFEALHLVEGCYAHLEFIDVRQLRDHIFDRGGVDISPCEPSYLDIPVGETNKLSSAGCTPVSSHEAENVPRYRLREVPPAPGHGTGLSCRRGKR